MQTCQIFINYVLSQHLWPGCWFNNNDFILLIHALSLNHFEPVLSYHRSLTEGFCATTRYVDLPEPVSCHSLQENLGMNELNKWHKNMAVYHLAPVSRFISLLHRSLQLLILTQSFSISNYRSLLHCHHHQYRCF